MMSIQSKRELVATVAPRYRAANRTEKQRILDELVASTGYERKYAIHLLNHPSKREARPRRKRSRRYGPTVKLALIQIWRTANCICSKRLVPCLAEFVAVLERHGELVLDAATKGLLLSLSVSTADRLLHGERLQPPRRGLGTTKPGTLLKHSIPIRTFADWDEARPGFVEVDLVAHCGQSAQGEFLFSLVLTDIATGWTVCVGVRNKSQRAVTQAIDQARQALPFPLLGLDSDNGSEFINATLKRYCDQHHITFTRCRPYRKNDQAHVEQKNWSIVRQTVGYDRFEGPVPLRRLTALYAVLNPYVNFFQPVLKLQSKERVGSKVKKKYDTAKTPYQRVLDSSDVDEDHKQPLRELYPSLNPVALLRQLQEHQEALWKLATVRSTNEATIPQDSVRSTNEATIPPGLDS